MSTQRLEVVFADTGKVDFFTIDTRGISVVCELKRQIYKKYAIDPLSQRLSLEAGVDNFNYPSRIICKTRKSVRNASVEIIIHGYNQDEYPVKIDTNDNQLDLKFLFSKIIGEYAEYIRFTFNDKQISDNQVLSNVSNMLIRFWLEYPPTKKDHGFIHRTMPKLLNYEAQYTTIGETLRKKCAEIPNLRHFGTRKYLPDGTRGDYEWMTFKQVNDHVTNIASGLRYLGLKPHQSKVGICSINRIEWVLADFANHVQSFITVPLYDTLSKNAIEFVINHAGIELIFCSLKTLNEIIKCKQKCPTLKYIILMDSDIANKNDIKVTGYTHLFSEIESIGSQHVFQDVLPSPSDLYTICYTSGTTGNPKGAMLAHGQIMAAVNGWLTRTPKEYMQGNDDVILSYLPLAHNYERSVEIMCLRVGARIGFFSGEIKELINDIALLQPTLFIGVPRVFQKIQDKIVSEVDKQSFIKKYIFNYAFGSKQLGIKQGVEASPLWDKIVFNKIRMKFGNKIIACMSGSAPLSTDTAYFIKTCLSNIVGEGYGLTEISSSGTTTDILDYEYGHVGTPVPTTEIKLVSVNDMNYTIYDKPFPRGEIWIRGNTVFNGYFKDKIKTDDVLFKNGWFASGDIGLWTENGKLKIIDRKKNIFKLSQGEYIRPEYIENVYKMSKYIANIFVYGDSNTTFLVGIVVPDWEVIDEWINVNHKQNKLAINNLNELCENNIIRKLIQDDMDYIGQREELTGFEKCKKFVLIKDDFTPENGILTATLKLKRHHAKLFFKKEIDKLYQQRSKL